MDARSIALAIPLFFLFIGVEILITRRHPDRGYALADAVSNLSCGVGQQVIGAVAGAAKIAAYAFVYHHLRLLTVSPRSLAAWLVLFVALDLCYYAYHRASHRVNFFWATHAVHHQSEEYNLTTALRQSWFTSFTSFLFYLPLALIGFPPLMFVLTLTANTLYQFWIHTRVVDRLGAIEAVLNTPSHHRVHHGTDPLYIDRNYAGVFIVWDRLFGTFQREEHEPVYGTVKPLASWNPVWANLEPWVHLARMARQTGRLRDKVLVWFMPPEWRPADLGGPVTVPEVSRAAQRKYATPAPVGLAVYVVVSFALAAAVTMALLLFASALTASKCAAIAAVMLLGLVTMGALFEAKAWAVPLEWCRLAAAAALGCWLARGTAAFVPVALLASAAGIALGVWVGRYRGLGSARREPTSTEGAGDEQARATA